MKLGSDEKIPVFAIIGLLLLIPLFAIVRGFLLMTLWSWFVSPLGVAPLGLTNAIGIGIIISLFKINVQDKNLEKVVLENALFIVVTFLFGYAVHLFM